MVVTSASNVWAVGDEDVSGKATTLILHWNGKTWSQVSSPTGEPAQLDGATASSAGNAWAVGYKYVETVVNGVSYSTQQTVILHWNGKVWATASSPNPRTSYGLWDDQLNGVAATSASNAWAVGTEEIPGVEPQLGQLHHDPALERQDLEPGAQPESVLRDLRHPQRRGGILSEKRVGGRDGQRRR
jgi:hypothetical protein